MKKIFIFSVLVLCLNVSVLAGQHSVKDFDGSGIDVLHRPTPRIHKLYDGPDFAEDVYYMDGHRSGPCMRLLCDHNFDLDPEELKTAITNPDNTFRFYNQTWHAAELVETEALPLNLQGMTVSLFSLPHLLQFQQADRPYGVLGVREFWAEYEGYSVTEGERRFWVRHVLSE